MTQTFDQARAHTASHVVGAKQKLYGNGLQGWVQTGVLWQLMEHGTATPSALADLLGCSLNSVQRAIPVLLQCKLVQAMPAWPGAKRQMYGLTRLGIDAALPITLADWQGAAPPPEVPHSLQPAPADHPTD